jgi:small-conductance mechanosensitive channel
MRTKLLAILAALMLVGAMVAIFLVKGMAIYISVIAIGMAVALQKYVASFFGYFVISLSRMFQVGDRIRIDKWKGDVRQIRLFHFVLDEVGEDEKLGGELTGRLLHMPNLIVLDQPVVNYSKGHSDKHKAIPCEYVFDEIRVPIKNSSDVSKAAQLLQQIIDEEDKAYLLDAKNAFKGNYPTFLREAEYHRRVLIHIEPDRIWLKGKYVAPFRVRNELRTKMYLRFLEHAGKDKDITLA